MIEDSDWESDDSVPSGPKTQSLAHAFICAGNGIGHAVMAERNMKIHLAIAVLVVIAGFLFGLDAASWIAVILCIFGVLAAECVNTAIEAVVDLVSPQYSDLARIAKDCAAGAVYLMAIGSVIVGLIVFIPHIVNVAVS